MKKEYQGMIFAYESDGIHRFAPTSQDACKNAPKALPCAAVSTKEDGPAAGMEGCASVSFNEDASCTFDWQKNGFTSHFSSGDIRVETRHSIEGGVVRQVTYATNTGSETKTLRHLSSALICGLDRGGEQYWFQPEKFTVHFCHYGWAREAQWCSVPLIDLGVSPGSDKNVGFQSTYRISSKGSWSTGSYYPLVILEDKEIHTSYFTELIGPTNWTIEIGHRGDPKEGTFYIEANSADEVCGEWTCPLAPGETYEAVPAIYGCVHGGFEQAVEVLTAYKRTHTLSHWEDELPNLCFNTYMNSLHGGLSAEKILPLIDATAECGAEIFIIDAGWCAKPTDQEWTQNLGSWLPCEERFLPYGFAGIADYIKEKGMIPGIWMEIEAVTSGSPLHQKGLYLKDANGNHVGGGNRHFADMTKPEVREFLKNAIDRLYHMGFRYLKNDYNGSTLSGCSIDGSSLGEGNNVYAKAVRDFFVDIRKTYPDLILENCGSGAMRCDQGMLSIFSLQSITDEEGYLYMPSILAGSGAVMPPEKEGVWTYVYPQPQSPSLESEFNSPAYRQNRADGEETVFGMVTGMLGVMTWGGRLDCMDDKNKALVKEAAAVYKNCRSYVAEGFPIYPCGNVRKGDGKNTAYGLKKGSSILLAAWRFSEKENTLSIDLSRYGNVRSANILYPSDLSGVEYTVEKNTLHITFAKNHSARLFEINLAE